MANWKSGNMPDQTGRTVIITGANSGLGLASAHALVEKGAQVIMASRDKTKSLQALDQIKARFPQAKIEYIPLNLASLASVREFTAEFTQKYHKLNLLLNNAGVMAIPRRETEDGFEMQLGTNHLGHFALTGLLLKRLLVTPNSRVVTTSSFVHWNGKINFDDLQSSRNYSRYGAYGQSKLANLLFMYELHRRLSADGSKTLSLGAHPGYANTNLQHTSTQAAAAKFEGFFYSFSNNFMAQSAEMGALPQLYAGTVADVKGGQFYGPRFLFVGYPGVARTSGAAKNPEAARRLWEISEKLTGINYIFGPKSHPGQFPGGSQQN